MKIIKFGTYNGTVAIYDHKCPLRLSDIARRYKLEFEPELFPAVRYRIGELGVTVDIFHTGKCTILGARSVEIMSKATYKIKDLLEVCTWLMPTYVSSTLSAAWQ